MDSGNQKYLSIESIEEKNDFIMKCIDWYKGIDKKVSDVKDKKKIFAIQKAV